jgi:hypothetical protein
MPGSCFVCAVGRPPKRVIRDRGSLYHSGRVSPIRNFTYSVGAAVEGYVYTVHYIGIPRGLTLGQGLLD